MSQNDTKTGPVFPTDRSGFATEWAPAIRALAELYPQLELHRPLVEQVDSLTLFELISIWEKQVGQLDDACVDWVARRGVPLDDVPGLRLPAKAKN